MSDVVIKPRKLAGHITVPPSKSVAHRAVIAQALAGGGIINNLEFSDDITATKRCMDMLLGSSPSPVLDCHESGSTLRFMIPLALAFGKQVTFTGTPRLLERPLDVYERLFEIKRGDGCVTVSGGMEPGEFRLDGGVSSQFVTGLLFALPLLDSDSTIIMTSRLESRPYVDLTLSVLNHYGVEVVNDNYERFVIKGKQKFQCRDYTVEGDYSQAAFWLVADALGSNIVCEGLNLDSLQGDRAIVDIIESGTKTVDVTDIPDLVPILAVLFCLRAGETRITGAGRLRLKECDRLSVITRELNKLGANITEFPDSLIIKGVKTLSGTEVTAPSDHRIAMALAVAATCCSCDVTIHGAECVSKSYPAFWEHYKALGGVLT